MGGGCFVTPYNIGELEAIVDGNWRTIYDIYFSLKSWQSITHTHISTEIEFGEMIWSYHPYIL